jgi:sugar (pentulose or hexulose) kinase
LIADVFGKRVVVLETEEGSAYGAACSRWSVREDTRPLQQFAKTPFGKSRRLCRSPDCMSGIAPGTRTYQSLYPALRTLTQATIV